MKKHEQVARDKSLLKAKKDLKTSVNNLKKVNADLPSVMSKSKTTKKVELPGRGAHEFDEFAAGHISSDVLDLEGNKSPQPKRAKAKTIEIRADEVGPDAPET